MYYTSEEFWKDAPEGATHYDTSPDVYPWLKKEIGGGKYWHFNQWAHLKELTIESDFIIPRPIQSPVYTQEMVDAGVIPSVGMECLLLDSQLHNAEYEKCTIDFVGSNIIVYSSKACTEVTVYIEFAEFKPLTAPITLEEQAIKEACYIVDDSKRCNDTNINIDCSAAQKAVIVTLIKNGYIKPLTVEGK